MPRSQLKDFGKALRQAGNSWNTIPELADSYQPTSFRHGWFRTLIAKIITWLIEPVLGPILETHHCTINHLSSEVLQMQKQLKVEHERIVNLRERDLLYAELFDQLGLHDCDDDRPGLVALQWQLDVNALIKQNAINHEHLLVLLGATAKDHAETDDRWQIPIYESTWMKKTREWIARNEGQIQLMKPAFKKVPDIELFNTVILKKMDWKLSDDGGARKENIEAWTCGLLDSMNRSSMAMERLLGLELNDEDPTKDRLTIVDLIQGRSMLVDQMLQITYGHVDGDGAPYLKSGTLDGHQAFISGLFPILGLHWHNEQDGVVDGRHHVLGSKFITQLQELLGYQATQHEPSWTNYEGLNAGCEVCQAIQQHACQSSEAADSWWCTAAWQDSGTT